MLRTHIFATALALPIFICGLAASAQTGADVGPCSSEAGVSYTKCKPSQLQEPKHSKPRAKSAGEPKTVVHDGGTAEPTEKLSPSVPQAEASQQLEDTNKLLAATDEDLKQIDVRPQDSGQQETSSQIKVYAQQAKDAIKEGDIERAHNLATKANALSKEAAKP